MMMKDGTYIAVVGTILRDLSKHRVLDSVLLLEQVTVDGLLGHIVDVIR